MITALKCMIPTMLLFCLLDFLWIGWIGKSLYFNQLGPFLNIEGNQLNVNLTAALVVYVLFALMIWCVVLPLAQNQIMSSFLYGAFLGLIVYGVYDMTNLSVLKNWPLHISLIDWLWGTFLCSVTSGFCSWIKHYLVLTPS
ncbi:DUF2177 family protein [Legionella worsleiensis]|uniref:Membrane protein n=1 Tax=Legionella worsleiensis TaxID=45076 RepID=A0A0W1AL79_9GAMM|nr:DUF2177 family protein [Legionella worsleiensis]KTD81944.1 membrane protein [Legionella worsleiensis]STY31301.1 membrane protein [Legionella worsleiensis]